MTRWFWLGFGALLALGAAAEAIAPAPGEPVLTVGDLAAGWGVAAAAALVARVRAPATAWLLLACAAAWFGGTLATELGSAGTWLLYVHRPLLVLAVIAAPRWRPLGQLRQLLVAAAFLAAIPDVAETGWAPAALAVALVAVAPRRGPFLACGLALALASIAVLADLSPGSLRALIVSYDLAIVLTAVALAAELRARLELADHVLEMGELGPLSSALASALGDPLIEVLDADVRVDDGREVTPVSDGGRVVALIAHAPDTLADPRVAGAAIAATRLALANAELTTELQAALAEVRASSRRLVVAAETARSGLERRLREGPLARLGRIAGELSDPELAGRVASATRDLEDLAAGLHPRVLDERGLRGAVAALAADAPVDVTVEVAEGGWPKSVEAAAYFVCAEALTNVAKYAHASSAAVTICADERTLTVEISDDGIGGANPSTGSGLRGLSDRLVALGGRLEVVSEPGGGTRLMGSIPLG